MNKIGFDNEKYLSMQSEHIRERVDKFGDKLYLEFGGKLFDDYHASRVLPGFAPDSKLQMLLKMKDEAEIVIVINSDAIEQCKMRGDLGITYDLDALRLIRRGIPAGAALDMGITNKAFDSYEQGLIRDVIAARIPAKLDAARLFA